MFLIENKYYVDYQDMTIVIKEAILYNIQGFGKINLAKCRLRK